MGLPVCVVYSVISLVCIRIKEWQSAINYVHTRRLAISSP